jgi:hypothetical protein
MANQVYANNMEVACKAAQGKSICAFPDVCFTPPMTPATPPGVPIPYPNTGMASDTSDGSKTVQVSGQEVMLKDKSCFKQSTGDEAGSAPKKGVVTSKIKGKVYFNAWSMDVKFEGENVVRNLDLTTHNHASLSGNSPPWPYIDEVAVPGISEACKKEKEKEESACQDPPQSGNYKSSEECCKDPKCQEARNCMLVPYEKSPSPNCCPGKTGHHLLPNSLLQSSRGDSSTNVPGLAKTGPNAYTLEGGACVCVTGASNHEGDHGKIHDLTKDKLSAVMEAGPLTYDTAKAKAVEAHREVLTGGDGKPCSADCMEKQIDSSLKKSKTGEIEVRRKNGTSSKNYPMPGAGDAD